MASKWKYVGTYDRKMNERGRLVLPKDLAEMALLRNPEEDIFFYARRGESGTLVLQDHVEGDFESWFPVEVTSARRLSLRRVDPEGSFRKKKVVVKGAGERITVERAVKN